MGPNLHNVIGRKAGSLPNYDYSSAMKGADFVWDKEKLDRFIAKPDEVVPGNSMKGTSNNIRFRRFLLLSEQFERSCQDESPIGDAWRTTARSFCTTPHGVHP